MGAQFGFRDLKAYQLAFKLAMEIFQISKRVPKEETYSLTDQIRRSSRGVCANLAEAYRKRQYPRMFSSKVSDADGEGTETQVWLDFARECGYLTEDEHKRLSAGYEELGRMLGGMIERPEAFQAQTLKRRKP